MAFDPITAVLNVANTIIDRLIPDKTQAAAAKAQLVEMQLKGELDSIAGQIEINKVEAANVNWMVAGWRSGCGWVCVLGLLYQFFIAPLAAWASGVWHFPAPPSLDLGTLMTLLFGMLGLGAYRTVEKVQDVASNH